MPGSTANGWPFPLGSEPVRDGDNAIMNLANVAENRLRDLQVLGYSQGGLTTNASGVVNLFWQRAFGSPPGYSLSIYEPLNRAISAIPLSVDQSGVVLQLFDVGGNVYLSNAAIQVYVVAIGQRVGL